ncbi:MAG: hypothetical protein KIT82_11280, partial [Bradyrhizobium sp.]|nr:hypothetical protein [Bradyrhizobium sp.]
MTGVIPGRAQEGPEARYCSAVSSATVRHAFGRKKMRARLLPHSGKSMLFWDFLDSTPTAAPV